MPIRDNKGFVISIIIIALGLIAPTKSSSEQARRSRQNEPTKPQQNQFIKEWPYDVPYNILVSHILSNNLSAEDKAVLRSSLDDMKSGENQGPYWDEVRVATSKDGFTFEDTRRTVVTHASVPAAVVDNQGRVWLFYVDFDPEPLERLIRGEKVDFKAGFQGLAADVSDDGFTFRKVDLEIQDIVQGVAVDPHIVVAADGTFQLYYLGVSALELSPKSGDPAKSSGSHNIYLATAKSDLSKWRQQGVAWAGPHGGADPVVWQIDDKTYYIASGGIGKSIDGGYSFRETRETELPRVNDNGGPPGTPDILKVEEGYRLFHTTREGIKSLFSKDGINWREESGIRGLGADPTVVKLKDGTYLMYYKARMPSPQRPLSQAGLPSKQIEQLQQNHQPRFQQPPRPNEISVKATDAKYRTVSTKPTSGWFRTGQDADIMLSGIDFNNAGGPLLFNHPGNIASDGKRLLLADRNNNRILIWNKLPSANIEPDLVLGQKNFTTTNPGKALDQLNWPVGVATDGIHVLVADTYNDRILIWNSFPTKNGQPADLEIRGVGPGGPGQRDTAAAKRKIGWPWAVWTNGKKVIITSTASASALIWNSFPTRNNQPADIVLFADGNFGTPRAIASNGKHLLIGDHNAKINGRGGHFFWKTFPTRNDQKYDFFVAEASQMGERLGVDRLGKPGGGFLWAGMTDDGKLIGVVNGLYIWNSFPENENDAPDLKVGAGQGPKGYNFISSAGDGTGVVTAGGKLYISLSNGNKIIVFNSLPTKADQEPDFAIGAPDININTLAANYFITNGVPATNGKSLFVSSDFDRKLYVWKSLPDESGAFPDFVYTLDDGPWDSAVWQNSLVLAGKKTVYIWKTLPTDGHEPDVILRDRIGLIQLQDLRGAAIDEKYFYLADAQANKIYVFEGAPDQNSNPKFILSVNQPRRLSSDGKYLVVVTTLDNQTGHIKIFTIANLSNDAKPKTLDRRIAPTNLPEDALAAGGGFFIANTVGNIVYAWHDIEDALAGKPYDTILGKSSAQDAKPEIGKDKLFWPAGLAFDGSYLWVGEFKFSGRILRFSVGQ